jgi:hypothetical protein
MITLLADCRGERGAFQLGGGQGCNGGETLTIFKAKKNICRWGLIWMVILLIHNGQEYEQIPLDLVDL